MIQRALPKKLAKQKIGTGPTAIIASEDNDLAAIKVLDQQSKQTGKVTVKFSLFENEIIDEKQFLLKLVGFSTGFLI